MHCLCVPSPLVVRLYFGILLGEVVLKGVKSEKWCVNTKGKTIKKDDGAFVNEFKKRF